MYVPPAFREQDIGTLHAFVETYSFATLVSGGETRYVTHLPLMIDAAGGGKGVLLGHFAKANPHVGVLNGTRATAIFHGPHAYVSPSWYDGAKPASTY